MFKKSQTAIEFLLLMGGVLFFFTGFFLAIQEGMSDKITENINKNVYETALYVQNEISLASESRDGYSREFKLPENINGLDYDIEITEGFVYLHTINEKYAVSLQTVDVQMEDGITELNKGAMVNKIQREGGYICLNKDPCL